MPTDQQISYYTQVAAQVLAMCKKTQPDFWQPTSEMATAWGHAMARRPYPKEVYYQAVPEFYASSDADHGARPGVSDIVRHAKQLVAAWETDPEQRPKLEEWRAERAAERDRRLAMGLHPNRDMPPITAGQRPLPGTSSERGFRGELLAQLGMCRKTRKKGA